MTKMCFFETMYVFTVVQQRNRKGANNYGQLGINRICEQCNEPTDVSQTEVRFDNIKSIEGGGGHTLMLDNGGKVYGCGLNSSYQLASENDKLPTFERIKCLDKFKVTKLVCGWDSSFAITEDGFLLVWGSNAYSQLGITKDKIKNVKEPVKLAIDGIKQICCGLRHTVLLLNNGKVMIAGQGRKGQLGIVENGQPVIQTKCFQEVPGVENVKMIACGQNHTLTLTDENKLIAWGDNKHGQLGCHPTIQTHVNVPTVVQSAVNLSNVTTILAGWTHSVLLTDNGSVINYGRNSYGQLGCLNERRSELWVPQKIVFNKNVKQLAVGSEHNIVLTDDGELWSWGWNEHGNCGLGHDINVFQPTQIKLQDKAILIGTGSAHSFVLTEN